LATALIGCQPFSSHHVPGDEFGIGVSDAFFQSVLANKLLQKTTAIQLSNSHTLYFTDDYNLVSLIFRRLAIVNPPKPPKFPLLFKY
jgi:hypothetical protein